MLIQCLVLFLTIQLSLSLGISKYSLLMPNVKPSEPELYLCTPAKVNATTNYYIIAFEPNATANTAHHMILYGCKKPGSNKPVWNCGEMAHAMDKLGQTANPCADESQILYAWARDAPKLTLPEGVGFKVGGDSSIQYLVLQVHYAHVDHFKDGRTDDSGVFLHYSLRSMPKLAGVLVMGTGGSIPPMSTTYMDTACSINEDKTIYPFAYRTHTHSLGKVVSGYLVRNNSKGEMNWLELGKRDPLTPQMFYTMHNKASASKNDMFAARCTMVSNRQRWTRIGGTNDDEMCNFYIMYYVEKGEPLDMKYCFSMGPPYYDWMHDRDLLLNNIPDREASSL